MARTLIFVCEFTKNKVKTTPANAPTIDIADMLAPTGALLVSGGSPTQLTNMTGVYIYSYSAADGVLPVGLMRTADATVDLQDVPTYPMAFDANGLVKSSLYAILGTLLTETAGQIAAAFKKLFDVASPALTAASVNQTGDAYARLGSPVGASISADIAGVQNDTDNIQTRLPAALTSDGNIKADALKLNGATPNNLTSAQTASAVLDATASSYNTTGTIGAKINTSAATLGQGSISHTITVNDSTNSPLDGVEVWITTDLAGTNTVASGSTNAHGQITFMLDAGSYYQFCQLAGYNFSNPTAVTVS